MTTTTTSLLIYWPEDATTPLQAEGQASCCSILGWRRSRGPSHQIVVAGLVVGGKDEPALEQEGSSPAVVGEYFFASPPPEGCRGDKQLWVTLIGGRGDYSLIPPPRMHSIHLPSPYSVDINSVCVTWLLYTRSHPHPCHYLLGDGKQEREKMAAEVAIKNEYSSLSDFDLALKQMGEAASAASSSDRKVKGQASTAVRRKTEMAQDDRRGTNTTPTRSLLTRHSLTCAHIWGRSTSVSLALSSPTATDEDKERRKNLCASVLLDILVGILFGLVLWHQGGKILEQLFSFQREQQDEQQLSSSPLSFLSAEALYADVEWLKHHPGGFKLNVPLTSRLGALVQVVADFAKAASSVVSPFRVLQTLAVVGLGGGGLTTMLALTFDLLRLATIHITILFAIFARLYHLELSLLSSLWHLFRGRKKNVLRHRTDSSEYSTHQLLLGTLLFTILTLLFPTLALFYLFFTGLHLTVLLLQGGLALVFFLWRDLPFYPLAVYLLQPTRLVLRQPSSSALTCHPVTFATGEEAMTLVFSSGKEEKKEQAMGGNSKKDRRGKKKKEKVVNGLISAAGSTSSKGNNEEKEEKEEKEERTCVAVQPEISVLRLRHRRLPFSSLFHQYGRDYRLFWEECPSLCTSLSMLLTGALVPQQNQAEKERRKEKKEIGGEKNSSSSNNKNKLVFLRYRSFGQILTKVALVSAQGR